MGFINYRLRQYLVNRMFSVFHCKHVPTICLVLYSSRCLSTPFFIIINSQNMIVISFFIPILLLVWKWINFFSTYVFFPAPLPLSCFCDVLLIYQVWIHCKLVKLQALLTAIGTVNFSWSTQKLLAVTTVTLK